VTQYDEQPAARLSAFAAEGAEWIHIVDLDGAEAGEARQHALIGELAQALEIKIQSGGGVRSANDVAKLLEAGVSRVVVGSLAVTRPNDVAAWLKGPLREQMHELLSRERLAAAGVFEPSVVERLMAEHEAGTFDHRKQLWTLMMFEAWRQRWGVTVSPPTMEAMA
jgi:hypothetical protein